MIIRITIMVNSNNNNNKATAFKPTNRTKVRAVNPATETKDPDNRAIREAEACKIHILEPLPTPTRAQEVKCLDQDLRCIRTVELQLMDMTTVANKATARAQDPPQTCLGVPTHKVSLYTLPICALSIT